MFYKEEYFLLLKKSCFVVFSLVWSASIFSGEQKIIIQQIFTCLKSAMETLEKIVKYVGS